jgi:hypothetical protein
LRGGTAIARRSRTAATTAEGKKESWDMEGKDYKRMTVTSPVEGKDGKTYWPKVGMGWLKADGNLSIKLDSLPINGKLFVSEWTPFNRERQRDLPAVGSMAPVEQTISHGDDMPF